MFRLIPIVLLTLMLPPASAADPPTKPAKTKVAILLFPGVELLDFAGPGEAFAAADDSNGNDPLADQASRRGRLGDPARR
jgi:hypothetical protein